MDAGFLNFHGEEHFSTLDSTYFLDPSGDDTRSYDDTSNHESTWDWGGERELNGDIGLIPIPSNLDGDFLSSSPPSREDFHKIMCEWQQLVNIDTDNVGDLAVDVLPNNILESEDIEDVKPVVTDDLIQSVTDPNVDIIYAAATPASEEENELLTVCVIKEEEAMCRSTGEEEEEEDPMDSTLYKHFDLNSYINEQKRINRLRPGGKKIDMRNQRYVIDSNVSSDEDEHVDVETVYEPNVCVKQEVDDSSEVIASIGDSAVLGSHASTVERGDVSGMNYLTIDIKNETEVSPALFAATPFDSEEQRNSPAIFEEKPCVSKIFTETCVKNEDFCSVYSKNEHEMLVSPVIQAGDLNSLLEQFEATECTTNQVQPSFHEAAKVHEEKYRNGNLQTKQIVDARPERSIKQIKKSGKRKTVSLATTLPHNKKREKDISPRFDICLDHDYCASVDSSIKDEKSFFIKDEKSLLRNQPTVKTADGKLMVSLLKVNTVKKRKLNLEEYKQRRKGRSANGSPAPCENENARRLQRMSIQPVAPPNYEVKTFVSIGVNTDQSWGRLQELMPSCQVNFNLNSLITSLVEHLPQVEEQTVKEHGEDKTIVYLDKNRLPIKTVHKHTQTITHRRRSSSSSCSSKSSRSNSRSPSPRRQHSISERMREVDERRVIYIGRIGDLITKEDLKRRFQHFGPVSNVSVHFRRTGVNYGFVTFRYREDAYEAVEHGNDNKSLPQYDLSFGGRRMFCQTSYSDLDNVNDEDVQPLSQVGEGNSFDALLRQARAKLQRDQKII